MRAVLSNPKGRRRWLLAALAIVGVVVTVTASELLREWERRTTAARLELRASQRFHAIEKGLTRSLSAIGSLAAFYRGSQRVTREEFAAFAGFLLGPDHPGRQSVQWVRRVPAEEREAYERGPGPAITERAAGGKRVAANSRSIYFPVRFIEPRAEQSDLLGLDLGAIPPLREAMDRAAADGGLAVSAPVPPVAQPEDESVVVWAFHPVQAAPAERAEAEAATRPVAGFVCGTVRVDRVAEEALEPRPIEGLHIRLTDVSGRRAQVLWDTAGPDADGEADRVPAAAPRHDDHAQTLEVGGRTWRLRAAATDAWGDGRSWVPTGVLGAGLLITALGLLAARGLIGRAEGAQTKVTEQTHELRRTNAELQRSNAELQRWREEMTQFSHLFSHDITDPLRRVTGYLQALRDRSADRLDEEASGFIKEAMDCCKRMQGLVADLLVFMRIDVHDPPTEEADCGSAAHEALWELGDEVERTGADVEVGWLPPVTGDPAELSQLFKRLIQRAVHMPERDPPRVRIEAEARGGRWLLTVTDNGPPISAAEAESLFQAFQPKHQRGGASRTGFGVIKRIVDRHSGRVWAEPADGEGARICIVLPREA